MKFITYGLIGPWSQTLQIKLPSISRIGKKLFMNSKTERNPNNKLRAFL